MGNNLPQEIRENINMEVNRLQEATAQVKEGTLENVYCKETRFSLLDEGSSDTQAVIASLKEDVSTIRTDVNQTLEGITKTQIHYDSMLERVARRLTKLEAIPDPNEKGLPLKRILTHYYWCCSSTKGRRPPSRSRQTFCKTS